MSSGGNFRLNASLRSKQNSLERQSSLSKISQPASLAHEDVRLVQLAFTLRLSIFQTAVAKALVLNVKNCYTEVLK